MNKPILIISGLATFIIAFSLGKCSSSSDIDLHNNDESVQEVVGAATEYTCSMHPQVRTPDKDAKCPICFMDLIPVPEGADNVPPNAIAMSESAMERAQIEVAPVIREFPRNIIQLVGTVETDETKQAAITAWFPGRIDTLLVDYTGATVKTGVPLAEVYSPELLVAQTELQEAIQSAKRIKGDSIIAKTARETIISARQKLSRWGLSDNQINALANATSPTDTITISSPIDGVVLTREVVTGEYVTVGQTLFQIADLENVWVLLDAHESDIPFLSIGQKIDLETDILPGKVFSSTIDFIDPVLNPKTRTVTIRLEVDNKGGELLPGSFVRGTVIGDLGENPPLIIPRSAVLMTGRRAVVFVQVPAEKPTFESRVVVLGERADEMYVVAEGLEEGELVVVQGAFKIDSELQIQAKPSMMSMVNESKKQQVSPDFIMSLNPLYSAYFSAQEALAADNFDKFLVAQGDIATMLTIVDDSSLSTESLEAWKKISETLLNSSSKSPDITSARIVFEDMSKAAIAIQNTFGHYSGTYYEMYCPMAFDFRGAFWLQRKDSLVNPYFGAEMLKCGETKKTFKPNGGSE
ncbi:MAG: efflux RND transporter periplasmic adaptor subunit [Phycisphaerales bacterium]|nr:efflux RND transporter periplasmic adaptor subunit [Planctomycetota bacterium]MBL6997965.1 efflux RND transporter periplasmic adaptor subunit [Phycisphaerales bacterium]